MVEFLLGLAEYVGPVVAAAATVPIVNGIKSLVSFIDRAPALVKQIVAVVVAYGLTELGALLNLALPTDLALFTGEDVEGLLSAGIAMAIHAGKKASGNPPSARTLVVALAFFLPVSAACQTGSATVRVIDRSLLDVVVEPATYTGEVGDTITFAAVAIDTISGDTIPSQIRWSSADSTGVSIDPTTGLATLLRAGTFTVNADVAEILSMIWFGEQDDGTWAEVYSPQRNFVYARTGTVPDELRMLVGEDRRLCLYIETTDGVFQPPADEVEWSSSDESVVTVSGSPVEGCPAFEDALAGMPVEELVPLLPLLRTASRPG